jgi:hypothetical protein
MRPAGPATDQQVRWRRAVVKAGFDPGAWYFPALAKAVWMGVPCLGISLSGLPYSGWAAGCFAGAALLTVCHTAVAEWRFDRWNDRAVAAARAGRWDSSPPPRASRVYLGAILALSLTGGMFVVLGLIRLVAGGA